MFKNSLKVFKFLVKLEKQIKLTSLWRYKMEITSFHVTKLLQIILSIQILYMMLKFQVHIFFFLWFEFPVC